MLQVLKVWLGQPPSLTGMEDDAPCVRAVHMARGLARGVAGCSPCNSRQLNFAHSQFGPCHLYIFEQVGVVNWGLIWGSISINMSLTS